MIKIKGRIFLLIFLVVFTMISGLFVINKFFLEKFYLSDRKESLLTIGKLVTNPHGKVDFQQLESDYNVLINVEKFQHLNSFLMDGHLTKQQVEYIRSSLEIGERVFININMHDYRGDSLYLFYPFPYLRGKYVEISTPLTYIEEGMRISTEYNLKMLGLTLLVGITLAFILEKGIDDLTSTNERLKEEIEKERELEKLRKEFIANVSHELKTPIAIIQGYAQGLHENIADESSKEFYTETIIEESKKMDFLVKELLLISKMESGQLKLNKDSFNIKELIDDISERLKVKYKGYSVKITGGNVDVYGDEIYIGRVLQNLIENGFKYVYGDKVIEIYIKNEDKFCKIDIVNRVEDITQEEIKKIWVPFYREKKSRNKEGYGLGLAIVKGILQSHGTEFGAEVNKDKLKIWFQLPKKAFF